MLVVGWISEASLGRGEVAVVHRLASQDRTARVAGTSGYVHLLKLYAEATALWQSIEDGRGGYAMGCRVFVKYEQKAVPWSDKLMMSILYVVSLINLI